MPSNADDTAPPSAVLMSAMGAFDCVCVGVGVGMVSTARDKVVVVTIVVVETAGVVAGPSAVTRELVASTWLCAGAATGVSVTTA